MVQALSEIIDNEDGARPVIVQFQNSELLEGEEGKLETGLFKKSRKKKVVAVASKKIRYAGNITKDEDQDDLCNRYLLISNRKTGKVRLVAVDTVTVTPQFHSTRKLNDITDTSGVNLNSSISQLNKEFGSRKIKRITEQKERLKMNIDDVKEQLEQTVARVEIGDESLVLESAENDSVYRPPINRNASIREEVYELNNIIPESVLDSLEEEASELLSSDLNKSESSSFIKTKLVELQNSSAHNVVGKSKLLLYIDYLIRYITKPAKNITKKFVLCQSSKEVNSHVLDNFSVTSNTGRARPLSMRDKTICYILVLSMIAFDYQLNVEDLSKNIKIGVKKLQEMSRILAFSQHGKDKCVMTVKIPLPPAVSLSPRKRKSFNK